MLERTPILEFKFASAEAAGEIAGLAAAYGGEPDALGDIIAPGAFTTTLSEHAAAGTSPAMLWSHQMGEPIGRWISLREVEAGLQVTGKLSDTARGRDARTLATDGALGMSIGFRTRDADYDEQGHRILRAVELVEISLVAAPANTRARISSIKSALAAGEALTPRILEHALRDAGCPKSLAASVITKGWRGAADSRREAEKAAMAKIVNSLARHTAKIKEIR